jgi:transglutaminase/protease-like cytokinesis protein 3
VNFTQLYNALLHCINIHTVYTFGYAITNEQNLKSNNKILHAWSLVKINSKWIPIDSTWGIFEGRLPISHVFESYFERTFKFVSIDLNCKPKSKFDIQFLENES